MPRSTGFIFATVLLTVTGGAVAHAQDAGPLPERTAGRKVLLGVQVSAGGRWDDVRLCVATGQGVQGGPAADVALTVDARVGPRLLVRTRIPVMRPILFGAAFRMLQLEPDVGLLFRLRATPTMALLVGPVAGVTLHYGPDWRTGKNGPRFFALGPKIGGTVALDWPRLGRTFGVQLGLTAYATLLRGVNDPEDHLGGVVGGMAELGFYF